MMSELRGTVPTDKYDHLLTGGIGFLDRTKSDIEKDINTNFLSKDEFDDFLRLRYPLQLKRVTRHNSQTYYDKKTLSSVDRKETTAEHVGNGPKLIDFFIFSEPEFQHLDRQRCHDLWHYHDDCEIESGDTSLKDKEARISKEGKEREGILNLEMKYPKALKLHLKNLDNEFRELKTEEAKFGKGIDRFEALLHELDYPEDWRPKGWTEDVVRDRYTPDLKYSPTFMRYFETIILYLRENGYFNTDQ